MKKYWLLLLLAAVLLTGCQEQTQTTEPTAGETAAATEETLPPQEPGRLLEDAELTAATGGAVRLYQTADLDVREILFAGDGVLLVSGEKLTLLAGENLQQEYAVKVRQELTSADPYFVWGGQGVAYFDEKEHVYVLLDSQLQQTDILECPVDALGIPVLSQDLQTLYYTTDTAVRAMDISSGISRLLRQGASAARQTEGLLFAGRALLYSQDGMYYMISTENGQSLYEGDHVPNIVTGNRVYFQTQTDYITQWTLGTWHGTAQAFFPTEDVEELQVNMTAMAAVSRSGSTLDWYDLSLGLRSARLELPEGTQISALTVDDQGCVWFLDGNGDLACWDPAESALKTPVVCLGNSYTAQDPDVAGLELLEQQAQEMGEQYGMEILLDVSGLSYSGYTFTSEYRTAAFEKCLAAVDGALAALPAELLEQLGDLRLYLAGEIQGPTAGVQYWDSGTAVLVVQMSDGMETELYRQLYHVMDSWIMSECKLLDDWDDLNPQGFRYDYDYSENRNRQDLSALEGEDPAFLDVLGMSYPREDRATLFAWAMTEQGQGRLESPILQQKLQLLCKAIRKGLSLKGESYPWEQYLAD